MLVRARNVPAADGQPQRPRDGARLGRQGPLPFPALAVMRVVPALRLAPPFPTPSSGVMEDAERPVPSVGLTGLHVPLVPGGSAPWVAHRSPQYPGATTPRLLLPLREAIPPGWLLRL